MATQGVALSCHMAGRQPYNRLPFFLPRKAFEV